MKKREDRFVRIHVVDVSRATIEIWIFCERWRACPELGDFFLIFRIVESLVPADDLAPETADMGGHFGDIGAIDFFGGMADFIGADVDVGHIFGGSE